MKLQTRIPQQKRGIGTKKCIIEAATKLFFEKGYHKTSIVEIAANAGVAVGSVYSYFKDKKEIFIEIIKICCNNTAKLASFTEEDISNGDRREHIRMTIEKVIAKHDFSPQLIKEMIIMGCLDDKIKELIVKLENTMIETIKKYLTVCKEDLRVKDIDTAAYIVFVTIDSIVHKIKICKSNIDTTKLVLELTDAIYRYLF